MAGMELRAITTFVRAAELGSLRKAAAAQGLSPQAASQSLAHLESRLGVRLFHRTTRALSLTAEGRRLLEAARPSLLGLERALHSVQRAKDEMAGPLRIIAPRTGFRPVLLALLDGFCAAHPEIQPDLQLEDRIGNWVEDRVDVGFRVGASADEGVVARRLFPLQLVICAAPAYLDRHGMPASLDALPGHRCSAFRHPGTGALLPWSVKVGTGVVDHPVAAALATNDEDMELDAVLAGHCIGQLAGTSAAAHVRTGRLVPLLTRHVAERASFVLYYGSRVAQPLRVRRFIAYAVERLADGAGLVMSARELETAEAKARKRYARPKRAQRA